jgi:hypothetical protein
VAWVALELILLAAIALLAWRIGAILGWATPRATALFAPGAIVLVALFQPVKAELRAGQVHVVLALLYAAWLLGHLGRRPRLTGAALAALALVKLAGLPLWIYLAARRQWRALGWAAALLAAALAVAVPAFGAGFWAEDLRRMVALGGQAESAAPAYQTVASLLRQLLAADPIWSPAPLAHAPGLVAPLFAGIGVALLAVTLIAGRRKQDAPVALAVLCLVVPLQPAGEQHHYSLLLPVLLLLALAHARVARDHAAIALGGTALALFAVPSYFLRDGWAGFPGVLLAYPRLLGALLLWALLVFRWPRPDDTPGIT